MIQLILNILLMPATEKLLGTIALHCLSKLAKSTTNNVDDQIVDAVTQALGK